MRRIWKVAAALIALGILGPPLWLVLTDAPAYAAKTGKVVDAQQKGIPDVAIIASAKFELRYALEGGAQGVLYRFVTYTDTDGNYSIPGMWSHAMTMFPVLPGATPRVKWVITAFKPGYLIVGDENGLVLDEKGRPVAEPNSVDTSPETHGWFAAMRIAPILMAQANASLQQVAIYYERVVWAQGWPENSRFSPSEVALRKIGYDFLVPFVCAAPSDQRMNWNPANFAYDRVKVFDELERTEPTNWDAAYSQPSLAYKTAKNICSAMTGAGAYP